MDEAAEARIGEIRDALGLLRGIVAKGFGELTIYERLSIRYLVIQLVEASARRLLRFSRDSWSGAFTSPWRRSSTYAGT